MYRDLVLNMMNLGYFDDGTIFCPTNDFVEEVNEFILSLLSDQEITYLSSDTSCQSDQEEEMQSERFTLEFLNDIKCSSILNCRLKLKTGVPIVLMRNIY